LATAARALARTATKAPPPSWKIPPFRTGCEAVRSQAHLLRPIEKLTVSQWAVRNRGYDPEILPWQPEVMDALSDPATSEVGLLGPSQGGKSDIGLAWTGWIIDTDPSDMLISQPSQALTQNFVETRLNPMIEATDAVKAKLSPDPNANNIWLKKFRGMFLSSVWPVPAQFSQRPIRYGWLDDYDQFPDDIEGQGSGISLLEGRHASFEGREKKFVSSSPADDTGGKTEAFVAGGTDERLQPECPHCGERWEIDLLRDLKFDARGTPDEAEASAHVACASNGCILAPGDRRAVLKSLLALPARGFVARRADVSRRRRTFRIDGLMALTSWPKLARLWREAQIEWETRQDESLLRTFVNTKAGKNYRSQLSGEKPIDSETLKLRREKGFHLGTIPAGVKTWVLTIDVQSNRVECAAIGIGEGLESWLFDRFSVDVLEDGLTSLAPFSHSEHSRVLLPLFNKRYPLADGSGLSPPPLTVQMDTGGGGVKGEGATEFAKKFWELARAAGVHPARITLTKGGNKPTAELMPRARFADQKVRGGPKRTSAQLWLPNVHRFKGIVDARFRRTDAGPGYIHLPGGRTGGGPLPPSVDEGGTGRLLDHHVEEITAEELQKGRWVKIRPRNETLDLLVAAFAAISRPPFAQTRTHMRWVPGDFRVPDQARPDVEAIEPEPPKTAPPKTDPAPPLVQEGAAAAPRLIAKKNWVAPRRGDWLNRRR
jgi:phage terminase large subunit GpA-like protein